MADKFGNLIKESVRLAGLNIQEGMLYDKQGRPVKTLKKYVHDLIFEPSCFCCKADNYRFGIPHPFF
jgi:hypothetical protein